MLRGLILILIVSVLVTQLLSACSSSRESASRGSQYEVDSGVGIGKRWRDNRVFATEVKTEDLSKDGIHDPKNKAIIDLQEPSAGLGSFPLDRRGDVDWVKAMDLGVIKPLVDISGKSKMMTLDMDILFKNTDQMPWVKFQHLSHTTLMVCSSCHPAVFIQKKGANNLSMDSILAGEQCGVCHGRAAFALWTCERCHNVPHEGTPKNWNEVMGVKTTEDEAEQ
jgi:c(7)-type cytochrome triheme protein